MLPAGHFTFPLSVRARVASDRIIKSTAPTHGTVTQHHDVSVVGFHAVQKPRRRQINSVPDHDGCRAIKWSAGKTARHSAALQASKSPPADTFRLAVATPALPDLTEHPSPLSAS